MTSRLDIKISCGRRLFDRKAREKCVWRRPMFTWETAALTRPLSKHRSLTSLCHVNREWFSVWRVFGVEGNAMLLTFHRVLKDSSSSLFSNRDSWFLYTKRVPSHSFLFLYFGVLSHVYLPSIGVIMDKKERKRKPTFFYVSDVYL